MSNPGKHAKPLRYPTSKQHTPSLLLLLLSSMHSWKQLCVFGNFMHASHFSWDSPDSNASISAFPPCNDDHLTQQSEMNKDLYNNPASLYMSFSSVYSPLTCQI